MVSSIVPGAGAGGALGLDPRLARNANAATPQQRDAQASSDTVEVSAASIALARESVREAMAEVQLALALGQDAQTMLVKVQELARDGGSQEDLQALLDDFSARVEDAASRGATLVTGRSISILAEPGGAPILAAGVDLRLKADPKAGDVMQVSSEAAVDDAGLAAAAQASLEGLQRAMSGLQDVARSLEAHQGFLGAAEGALKSSVRSDLDAESARLLALQVRQGLEAAGARSIANAEPQAVLALFRA